ncbi:8150_t:CDS:2 [Entrophospora sp. SA101]|nr:8150_t:CDS:2 [Entrophospora sp. SA101]
MTDFQDAEAWSNVSQQTIHNCWLKTGILPERTITEPFSINDKDEEKDLEMLLEKLPNSNNLSANEYIHVEDENVWTDLTDEDIIEMVNQEEQSSEEEVESMEEIKIISNKVAKESVDTVLKYLYQQGPEFGEVDEEVNTEYPVEEYQTQTGDYKLFEDTDSNPSEVTDSELIQFNLLETNVDCMSEEDTAKQAVEEDLITLEEDNSKQLEVTPYLIFSESNYTSGGGNNSKITQEPISSYYIDSDQGSDTERLYVKNIPSSEEASPKKKNKEKEIVSPIISAPPSPLQGKSEEEKEIQLSGISTNLRVMTTTINLNPTIKDILTGIPSVEIGPTGGGILGKLEKALGEYDCWVPGCKNKVRGKYTKCQTCNKCEHEGCTKETYNQSRWCGDCWLRCKRPYCFKVGRIGGNNCSEHQSEEPVPCAWMGCGNKSENNRGYCQACQDKSDEMCDTPKCYQPRCKNSDLYCQECWEKNMKGIKGNTTTKTTTKGISSNTTTESGNSEGPSYKCLLNACIKKVYENGEKCSNHKRCEHEGCVEEAPFLFRYCKRCQMCCRTKNCFDPRERDEAYCYNHQTKEKTQCAVVNCHEKAGGRAWEYCDKCCMDISTLGQVTGCDEHDTINLSCNKCQKINIFKEYNEIRKEALKAKNVTFYALNKTKPSLVMAGASASNGLKSILKDNTNSTVNSITSSMGSQPSFISTVSSNSTGTSSLFGTNPRQTTSTSAGPANVNQALINQMAKMEETIQVLHTEVKENKETCTNCNRKGHVAKNCYAKSIKYNDVPQTPCHNCGRKGHWAKDCYAPKQCNNCNGKGHLAKYCNKGVKCYGCGNFGHIAKNARRKRKVKTKETTIIRKGDGSAKNTNEHPQTVPDCVTCDVEIWGTKVKAIVDTGSSGSIISKQCLDQLKRKIEESSNVSLIGINGQKHRPLGIVRNVHVTLYNKHPIEVTMQVTEATNYELILGVDWLRAINRVISIGEKILTTTAYGTTNKHPIKVEKKPSIVEQPGDEEYEEESIQEEFAFLNKIITGHKPEQMIRTFTNIEWEDLEEEQKPTIDRELTLKQQQKLDKFLQKHDDMFAGGLYELGHTQEEVHSIPTNCPFPQNQRA